jgi:protein-disulfide isomerase/uncharacterized membrane protein
MAGTTPQATPARTLRILCLVLCTIGVCLSADLVRLHVRVHTDPNYQSYCAISERVDCSTVALSAQSVFAGLPVAVWGLLVYLLMAALVIWGLRRRLHGPGWPIGMLFGLSVVASVISVVLGFISYVVIKSACVVCMGTYLVNIVLACVTWFELRRLRLGVVTAVKADLAALSGAARRPAALLAVAFGVATLVLWLAVPSYWEVMELLGPGGLRVGTTSEGHPWVGGAFDKEPLLEIVEYSDYQCPFCQRGHDTMRQLVADHPDSVRLIHRHYPLDSACHPRLKRALHPFACRYAVLAHCAGAQDKFWEANDLLFAQGRRAEPVTVTELSETLGISAKELEACSNSTAAREAIDRDIADGLSLQIGGTPTFVVDGVTYPGRLPQEIIDQALAGL